MRFCNNNKKYLDGLSLVELVVVAALFVTVVASFFGAAQIL